MKHTICIPYSPCGGKFKNGKELRYALRGFDKHFQGEYEVVLVGPKKPDWYQGTWLKQTQGKLKSALKLAADTYPDGFFWWYDDCVLIQDQTGEQLMATPARKSWGRIWTSWGKKLEEIRVRLEKEGYTPWDYSKPHGPYWFDKGMIDESFADWPNMAGKFPFESWILSKRDHPRRFGVEAQYYNEFRNNPSADKIFVNWCDRGFTPELIAWLDGRFSIESPEEIGNVSPEENTTAGSEEISHTNSEEIGNMNNETDKPQRVLFTCHEGCDGRVWQWCGDGIRAFARDRNAVLIELPKCLDANPQWVLFDAFTASLAYPEGSEFAWVDSDLVISYPATDVWDCYPKKLHVCPKNGNYRDNLSGRFNLPQGYPNNCTGVVKWNREEAEKLSKWYSENKHRFPKSDGDQELLGVACHELGIPFSWFHRKMHVAGGAPPPHTAFKHKGGPSKVRWIPRFLATNLAEGISPPKFDTSLKTYRICNSGKESYGETVIDPVIAETKSQGISMAHIRAMEEVLKDDVFPCLVLEEDATLMGDAGKIPDNSEDWLFVGLSKYALNRKGKAFKWETPPTVDKGLIDMDSMLATHAIIYNNQSAAKRMLEFANNAVKNNRPIDVEIVLSCQREKISRKGLATPWFYQRGQNQSVTKFSIRQDDIIPTYDMSKYPLFPSEWAQMDERHIYALHTAACSDWQGSRIAVEIGSWKGRSTTALIEALNNGRLDHLHIIEIRPTPELHQVITCANDPSKVTLHTVSSWDAKIKNADFVFIDGDHKWAAAFDTLRAITWGAKVICMHDTQAHPRCGGCWGSAIVGQLMKDDKDWSWEEDCEDRPNEKTFRGFFVARKNDPEKFRMTED